MHNVSRILTLGILLLLTSATTWAASQKLTHKQKEARQIYSKARLIADDKEKINQLKEAVVLDPTFEEAYWLISSTYKELGDEKSSIIYLERAAKPQNRNYGKTCLRLGKAYFNTGNYLKAKEWFLKEAGKNLDWIKRCDEAQELKSHPVPFKPINLTKVNTDFDDYWPSITADGKRISITVLVGQREGKRDFTAQEDIYQSIYDDSLRIWRKSESIGSPTNTPQNEGSQNYSVDGRYMFFVACDRSTSVGGCDIYYSIRRGNTWSPPINCGRPINTQYWESTPSFSPAGDEIFFSSNRPGGMGGQDIWVSKVKILQSGQLQFSEPRNVGAPINTVEDDFCPFIAADNKTLYFSSKGHPGLGGYDIFAIRRDEQGKWGTPENIGYPINTHLDEIGFCVNAMGDKAYLASNGLQKNGRGKDIYEIELPSNLRPDPMEYVNGTVIDATTKRPLQTHVEVFQLEDNKVVFSSVTDEITGEYQAFLAPGKEYGINFNTPGYVYHTNKLVTEGSHDVSVEKIAVGKTAQLNNIFFDFDKATLQKKSYAELNHFVTFMKQNPKVSIELAGHTDSKGSRTYNIDLSQRRAQSVADYLTSKGIDASRIVCKGYGPDKPIADNDTEEGRSKNRRTEIIIIKDK